MYYNIAPRFLLVNTCVYFFVIANLYLLYLPFAIYVLYLFYVIQKGGFFVKIGEKIKKFRLIRKATQLDLGYHVKLNDLRVRQYETGKRNPKEDLVEKFAEALDVEPAALSNTEPDTIDGLMHTLFDLEDTFNITIEEDCSDGEVDYVFRFKYSDEKQAEQMREAFSSWLAAYKKYHTNPESDEEKKYESDMYELWKGQFPKNLVEDPESGKIICRENREWKL